METDDRLLGHKTCRRKRNACRVLAGVWRGGDATSGLFIGIDWADQKHDCYVINRDGRGFHQEISHSPEDIDTWVGEILKLADGKPIAIMLEQSRGPLVYALMFRENVLLYPVNPKQLARYRESYLVVARTIPLMPGIWQGCFVNELQP